MILDELKLLNSLVNTQHATLKVVAQLVVHASQKLEDKDAAELRDLLKRAVEGFDRVIERMGIVIDKSDGKGLHG